MDKRLMLPVGLVAATLAIGADYYFSQRAKPEHQPAQPAVQDTHRFEAGAYVASTKALSSGETIKLIVLPGKDGEWADTKCVVYTNRDMNQVAMQCPDAAREDLAVPMERDAADREAPAY